jgi:hypothetical protein
MFQTIDQLSSGSGPLCSVENVQSLSVSISSKPSDQSSVQHSVLPVCFLTTTRSHVPSRHRFKTFIAVEKGLVEHEIFVGQVGHYRRLCLLTTGLYAVRSLRVRLTNITLIHYEPQCATSVSCTKIK